MQAENLKVELTLPPDRGGETVVVYVKELTLAEIRAYFRGEELNKADAPPANEQDREDALWDSLLKIDDTATVADILRMSTATREQLYRFGATELAPLVAKIKAANPLFFRVDALKRGLALRSTMDTTSSVPAPVSSEPSAP